MRKSMDVVRAARDHKSEKRDNRKYRCCLGALFLLLLVGLALWTCMETQSEENDSTSPRKSKSRGRTRSKSASELSSSEEDSAQGFWSRYGRKLTLGVFTMLGGYTLYRYWDAAKQYLPSWMTPCVENVSPVLTPDGEHGWRSRFTPSVAIPAGLVGLTGLTGVCYAVNECREKPVISRQKPAPPKSSHVLTDEEQEAYELEEQKKWQEALAQRIPGWVVLRGGLKYHFQGVDNGIGVSFDGVFTKEEFESLHHTASGWQIVGDNIQYVPVEGVRTELEYAKFVCSDKSGRDKMVEAWREKLRASVAQAGGDHPEKNEKWECPITLELMTDPVYLSCGCEQRYERKNIEEWVGEHGQCLVSHAVSVSSINADPDMKAKIEAWKVKNPTWDASD